MTRMMYQARRGSTVTTTGRETAKTCPNTAKTSPRSRARSELELRQFIVGSTTIVYYCRNARGVREYIVSILTNISARLYGLYIRSRNTSVLHGKYRKENLYICVIKDTGSCVFISNWLHCIISISLLQVCSFALRVIKCLSYIARV